MNCNQIHGKQTSVKSHNHKTLKPILISFGVAFTLPFVVPCNK